MPEEAIDYSMTEVAEPEAAAPNLPDMRRRAPSPESALRLLSPAPTPNRMVKYKYASDAIAAMNAAGSWEEYNGILTQNADWLANAWFSKGAQEAAQVVGHVVSSKRMSEAAALREKMQTVQFQTMQKIVDTTTKNLSELSNVDFISQAMEGIRTNGLTSEWVGKINAQHAKEATNKTGAQSPFGKLQADLDAELTGQNRPEVVNRYMSAIELASTNKGKSIYMGMDDSGKPIFQMTEGGASPIGNPTVATQTMSQRKLLKYEAATELINHLERNMESGHVGIAGVLGENVGDKLLPQFGIDSFRGKRADVRATLVATREGLMREISDDTRFSNLDREQIDKALPSSGVFESLPDALQKLATVKRILSQRGKIYSAGVEGTPPLWSLSKEEIVNLHNEFKTSGGKKGIDYKTALDALERFH